MKLKKLKLSILVLFIGVFLVSCKSNDTKESNIKNQQNNETKKEESSGDVSKEEYKDIITMNYEKYIDPIELEKEMETELDNIADSKEELDNNEILEEIQKSFAKNKNNINSFKEILKKTKTDNSDLQRLNDALINECDNLVYDIDSRIKNLEEIKSDESINKVSKEVLINNLKKTISTQESYKSQFEKTILEIDSFLRKEIEN